MQFSKLLSFILLISVGLSGCDKLEYQAPDSILRVMPIGDSRVAGSAPVHESYRYELWKLFIDRGLLFDFVGGNVDGSAYPTYQNLEFDRDHQGVGGATSADVLQMVSAMNESQMPSIVLLGIGGNDLDNGQGTVPGVINNLESIVDVLQTKNPNIAIFLEEIAPGRSSYMTAERQAAYDAYRFAVHVFAKQKTSRQSSVISVDVGDQWKDAYLADDVHYNELGARVVAERYFNAISDFLD